MNETTTTTAEQKVAPVRIAKQLLGRMEPVVIIKLAEALLYLEQVLAETPKTTEKPEQESK